MNKKIWSPESWQEYIVKQEVNFEDHIKLSKILKIINTLPEIVSFEKVKRFREHLRKVKSQNYFILQVGECAESFDEFDQKYIDGYKLLFAEIEKNIKFPIIKIARLGGQFTKPRTKLFETRGEKILANYRGDMVNDIEFSDTARQSQPKRILEAYAQSAITANVTKDDFYLSHEALLLNYEQQLIKKHEDCYYSSSTYLLWVGRLTNFIDSAHIEFVSGIYNPVAIKVDSDFNEAELRSIIEKIGYDDAKLALVGRFGYKNIESNLRRLIPILKEYPKLIYISDPMHGNAFVTDKNIKTRNLDHILKEIELSFSILKEYGLKLEGLMLESYFGDVQECLGCDVVDDNLGQKYLSKCDPRLNFKQTMEVISKINNF